MAFMRRASLIIITIVILTTAATCNSFGQNHYRSMRVNHIQFTLPPHSRLTSESCFCPKDSLAYVPGSGSKYRYQYMAISGLRATNYFTSAAATERAHYFYARRQQKKLVQRNYCGTKCFEDLKADGRVVLYTSRDGSCVVVELDMDKLLLNDMHSNFLSMTIGLLEVLQAKENDASFGWPRGISQKIVAALYEMIPYPEQSSLLRFVADSNEQRSFVLLNPTIGLQVDATEFSEANGDWAWHLIGRNFVTFVRDASGNLIQSPLHRFQSGINSVPPNDVTDKNVLQASSADIQFSSLLNKNVYVFLQQENFKKNNSHSVDGPCAGFETDPFDKCNSVLYHFLNLAAFYDTQNDRVDRGQAANLSSFGARNLMVPVINIIINGRSEQVPLNTTVRQLCDSRSIPTNYHLRRLCKGRFVKMEFKKDDDILLIPGDTINY